MSELVFVDTNVLVHARDASEPTKGKQARVWLEALWRSRRGRTGFQVLNEYYVTVTQKLDPGLRRDRARADVPALMAWRPVAVEGAVLEDAFALQDRARLSWWDALVVAAARARNCRWLLTEDLEDGARYGDLRVIDPFQHGVDVIS